MEIFFQFILEFTSSKMAGEFADTVADKIHKIKAIIEDNDE